jgi:hypothetical protein
VPVDIHEVKGYRISLEEGQTWDDPLVITVTRLQASVILTALSGGLRDMTETLKEVKASADKGDTIAQLLYHPMLETAQDMQSSLREIVKVVHPDLYAELEAEEAKAAEAEAKDKGV